MLDRDTAPRKRPSPSLSGKNGKKIPKKYVTPEHLTKRSKLNKKQMQAGAAGAGDDGDASMQLQIDTRKIDKSQIDK